MRSKWAVSTLNVTLTLVISCLAACGGGGGSSDKSGQSGNAFDSGLASDRLLNTLTSEEAVNLCTTTEEFGKKEFTPENLCKLFSVVYITPAQPNEENSRQCEEVRKECLQEPQDQDSTCRQDSGRIKNCPASVNLYESCISEIAENFNDFAERADCQKLSLDFVEEFNAVFGGQVPMTPSCQVLSALCPSVLTDSNTES